MAYVETELKIYGLDQDSGHENVDGTEIEEAKFVECRQRGEGNVDDMMTSEGRYHSLRTSYH